MQFFFSIAFLLLLAGCSSGGGGEKVMINTKKDTHLVKKSAINPYASIDISPMDISYFPEDYPILKMTGKVLSPLPKARVIYSRPHRQGRKIFGALLKYGETWRLGANEATEIEFFQSVSINGKTIPKGRYIMYCIPEIDKWTIIFNTNLFCWGLKPDSKYDVAKLEASVQPAPSNIEYFTMVFRKTDTGADLVMAWDEVTARLPIVFNKQ